MNAESVGVGRSGLFRQPKRTLIKVGSNSSANSKVGKLLNALFVKPSFSQERANFRGFRARGVVVKPRLAIISPRESKSNCF